MEPGHIFGRLVLYIGCRTQQRQENVRRGKSVAGTDEARFGGNLSRRCCHLFSQLPGEPSL